MERFFGVLIEHFGGAFPAWLAPVQAVVAPITEHQLDYAYEVRERLRTRGFRIEVDSSNEKLGYKIRHWKTQKVPYILVVGKSEAAEETVNVNERGVEEKRTETIEQFAEELAKRVASRR
jgi:threonyl-tRNA synthetase